MQLKLRVGVGDTLTIDVKPTDTFQDLSDRLYNYGGVKVDLSQLKSNDKPFDMTTNVINYFLPKTKGRFLIFVVFLRATCFIMVVLIVLQLFKKILMKMESLDDSAGYVASQSRTILYIFLRMNQVQKKIKLL